jgi:hypothetical protein
MHVNHTQTLFSFAVVQEGKPTFDCYVEFAVRQKNVYHILVYTIDGQGLEKCLHDEMFRGLPSDAFALRLAKKGLVFPKKYPNNSPVKKTS